MKNKVYANTSIVTILSVAERGLGFLYRIVLSRLLGAEGLGIYQVALSLFAFFLTIGSGGIPITVSRIIAKNKAKNDFLGEQSAVGAGIFASLLLTLPACAILWIFGEKFTFLFSDARCYAVFKILLLGLTCTCICAVFRGHFWGNKEFLTSSVIDLAEETVMVIAGVLLLQNFSSAAVGAQRTAWAVVLSYLFSFAAATVCFFVKGGKISHPKKELKNLFNASLPITSVRASASLVNSAIAVLLPVTLMRAGFDEKSALEVFGVVSGMAVPVLFMPATLIGALALVLTPELSEDFYRNNVQRLRTNVARGIKFAFLVACAIIPYFFAFGEDFGAIAFSNLLAGQMIKRGCFILLPMSLTMISTSMLNAMGYEKRSLVFYFVGAAAMFLGIFLLPKYCGEYAYLIGLGASYCITAVCNLVFLFGKCPVYAKRWGQVCIQQYLPTIIITAFLTLSATLLRNLFAYFTGEILSLLFPAVLLSVETFLAYLATGAIPIHRIKRIFRKPEKFRPRRRRRNPSPIKKA